MNTVETGKFLMVAIGWQILTNFLPPING